MTRSAFLALAALVEGGSRPEGRTSATAATLREIAALPGLRGMYCTDRDVQGAFHTLAAIYASLEGATGSERAVEVAEISRLLGTPEDVEAAGFRRAAEVWRVVAETFPGQDPRARAIRSVWGREAWHLSSRAEQLDWPWPWP